MVYLLDPISVFWESICFSLCVSLSAKGQNFAVKGNYNYVVPSLWHKRQRSRSILSIVYYESSPSDETLNRDFLALLLWRQYEFPSGINIVQFSFLFFPIVAFRIVTVFLTWSVTPSDGLSQEKQIVRFYFVQLLYDFTESWPLRALITIVKLWIVYYRKKYLLSNWFDYKI